MVYAFLIAEKFVFFFLNVYFNPEKTSKITRLQIKYNA